MQQNLIHGHHSSLAGGTPDRARLGRAFAVALLAVLTLSACGAGSSDGMADWPGANEQGAYPESLPGQDSAGGGSEGSKDSVTSAVITTGDASIRTEDPQAAAGQFVDAVIAVGGQVSYSTLSNTGGEPEAMVTVRIPATEYQGIVESLDEFGEVLYQSTQVQEVGAELADLEARRKALESSIARLTELMTDAGTVTELLEAEDMLTQRQAELDSLTAQLKWLEDQVAMSTLTVTFAAGTAGFPTRPPTTLERAWSYFLDSAESILYVAVVLLPWLVILGGILLVVIVLIRRRRHRHAAPAPGPAPTAAPGGAPSPGPGPAPGPGEAPQP